MDLRSLAARLVRALVPCVAIVAVVASCSDRSGGQVALAVVPTLPSPTAIATTEPLVVPTSTPIPTAAPAPTATPLPTATAIPTSTPVPPPPPTATPLPVATAAALPATAVPATAVPEPTATPVPEPTATPGPTAEPTPTPEAPAEGDGDGDAEAEPSPTSTDHQITDVGYVTLGKAGDTWITIPSARVELIGFHEASHPGSQAINAAGTGLEMMVLASRGRGTPARSAADIVVPPGEPLRAPVTGTVVSSATYVLYCEHQDKLVYIEPDGLPGWQVRLFHVAGEIPAVGTRVIAGETIVATGGANPLPFESQIDKFTGEPSWAHVHVEVVDTNVPDDRPPGGGC